MGVYRSEGNNYYWDEQHLYGSSRTGIWNWGNGLPARPPVADASNPTVTDSLLLGSRNYELSNHLGNVLAVISDKKIGVASQSNSSLTDYYKAEVLTQQDYYPFGMQMPGRTFSVGSSYRYGFNGKENDNEVKNKEGSQLDYGFRMYDTRVGRFLSIDPLTKTYPWYTPFQFSGNSPIKNIDIEGAEEMPGDLVNRAMRMGINYIKAKTEQAVKATILSLVDYGKVQVERKIDEKVNSKDPFTSSMALTTEFIFGVGPQERNFGSDHPFTQSLKNSNLTTEALQAFNKGYNNYLSGKRKEVPLSYRVDFAYTYPIGGDTGPFKEAFVDGKFTASQFTGTADYRFSLSKDKNTLNITVYDTKTEYSALYHAPGTDKHSRSENPVMGETVQTYEFSIPMSEVRNRASEKKKK